MVRRANAIQAVSRGAVGVGANAIQVAKMAAAYLAGSAARGAVQGAGKNVQQRVSRYFNGDVNQPATARTVQQLRVMREVGGSGPLRAGRNRQYAVRGGNAVVIELGSCKVADLTTGSVLANIGSGRSLLSFPLQVETIGGRLFAMSKLYARWRFLKCVLRYVPAVSSATDGGLVIYYTQEVDDVYTVAEAVGTDAASSAIDNMEFSVREKANMALHLGPQLLYTTPSSSETAWHSAGVINVVSGGSLAISKTYGALYMDFEVRFEQPCAPFDVYAPINVSDSIVPTGSGSTGTLNGPIFAWSTDNLLLSSDSGSQWLVDPITGKVNLNGKIYLAPNSSMVVSLILRSNAVAFQIATVLDPGVVVAGIEVTGSSPDNIVHYSYATFTNTNPFVAGVLPRIPVAAVAVGFTTILVARLPFSSR
jgi:hypothetical protein